MQIGTLVNNVINNMNKKGKFLAISILRQTFCASSTGVAYFSLDTVAFKLAASGAT